MAGGSASGRARALKAFGLKPADIILTEQVHGNSVLVVDRKYLKKRHKAPVKADALITNIRGVILGILTADCLPIFLYDSARKAVALIHCGWRPLSKGIIPEVINRLSDEFSVAPRGLAVVFGPAIRECCYEVGSDFSDFTKESLTRRGNKLYFDLCREAKKRLAACGVCEGRIYDSRICTKCMNGDFFSYRKEGLGAGRSLSLLGLK